MCCKSAQIWLDKSNEDQLVDSGDKLQYLTTLVKLYYFVFVQPSMLIDNITDLQAILGGTLRAPGIHGEIEIKVSRVILTSES